MLLGAKKGIRDGFCHSINRYAINTWKIMTKMKNCHILSIEILEYKQLLWFVNVTKFACKWI